MIKNIYNLLSLLFLPFVNWLSQWISSVFKGLQKNFISLTAILISYFFVWNINQAQDLLLILNQKELYYNGTQVPLFFFGLSVTALLIWQAPKYLKSWNYDSISFAKLLFAIPDSFVEINTQISSSKRKIDKHIEFNMPRLLGTSFVLVYAFGILNAMEEIGLYKPKSLIQQADVLFLLCHGFLLLMLIDRFYHGIRRVLIIKYIRGPILSLLFAGILFLIFYFGTKNTEGQNDLYFLFLSTLLLAVYFFLFSLTKWENLSSVLLNRIFYRGFVFSAFVSFSIFCIVNIYTDLAQYINPISVFVFGVLFYIISGYLLIMFGKKYNLALFAILIFFVVFQSIKHQATNKFKHYEIKLAAAEAHDNRPNIENYLKSWLKLREKDIKKRKNKFPIYLVAAEGGGSKAAMFSNLVNHYLANLCPNYFDKHLLLLSGASDGVLGNSLFFDSKINDKILNNKITNTRTIIGTDTGLMFKNNFLSSSLASMMGRDLFQSIFGLSISKNRSEVLEIEWEKAAAKSFKAENILKHDFLDYYKKYPIGSLPLLMVNTTRVYDGNLTVISPVKLENSRFFEDTEDFYSNYLVCKNNMPFLKLSTAVSLGSRYPILNPAGQIKDCYQYLDAGYFDNYGLQTTKSVQSLLEKILKEEYPHLLNKVKIKTLIIKNTKEEVVNEDKTQPQILATVKTFFRAKNSIQSFKLSNVEDKIIFQLEPMPVSIGDQKQLVKPIIPLGRYLSGIAVKSIERNFTDNKKLLNNLDDIIKEIRAK